MGQSSSIPPAEESEALDLALEPVPAWCRGQQDPAVVTAAAVPHAVVPQLVRPVVAAFVPPWFDLTSLRDATMSVQEVNLPAVTTESDLALLGHFEHLTSLKCDQHSAPAPAAFAHIAGLVKMRTFKAEYCRYVNGSVLQHFRSWTALSTLHLYGCLCMDSAALGHLCEMQELTTLNIAYCSNISSEGLQHIGKLAALTDLNASGCFLFDANIVHLRPLENLKVLRLHGCSKAQRTPQENTKVVETISTMTQLEFLDISLCRFEPAGIVHLANLKNLNHLGIMTCFGDEDPSLAPLAFIPRIDGPKHMM